MGTSWYLGGAWADYTTGSPWSRRTLCGSGFIKGVHACHNYEVTAGTSSSEVYWVGVSAAGEDSGIAELRACDHSCECGTSGMLAVRPELVFDGMLSLFE